MIENVIGALLPVVVTLLLGFVAGWHHDFDSTHPAILNRMVMLYALPLTLFAGMAGMARDQVLAQGPLAVAILIGMGGGYAVVFLVSYYFIRRDPMTASLRAFAIAGPSVPFVEYPCSVIYLAPKAPFSSQSEA
jgi:malonate transporter and related proteins